LARQLSPELRARLLPDANATANKHKKPKGNCAHDLHGVSLFRERCKNYCDYGRTIKERMVLSTRVKLLKVPKSNKDLFNSHFIVYEVA